MLYAFCLPPRGCRQNIYLAINQCVVAHGPILYSAPPQGWCGNSGNLSCPLLIRYDKKSRKAHSNPFHYSVNQVIEKLILTYISRATIYNKLILNELRTINTNSDCKETLHFCKVVKQNPESYLSNFRDSFSFNSSAKTDVRREFAEKLRVTAKE